LKLLRVTPMKVAMAPAPASATRPQYSPASSAHGVTSANQRSSPAASAMLSSIGLWLCVEGAAAAGGRRDRKNLANSPFPEPPPHRPRHNAAQNGRK